MENEILSGMGKAMQYGICLLALYVAYNWARDRALDTKKGDFVSGIILYAYFCFWSSIAAGLFAHANGLEPSEGKLFYSDIIAAFIVTFVAFQIGAARGFKLRDEMETRRQNLGMSPRI
jgi:hypothetical protein